MFTPSPIEAELDEEILALLAKLKTTDKNSEEYTKLIERLIKLHKLKSEESSIGREQHKLEAEVNAPRIKPPSADTMLIVAANILGILWVARYEREHVLSRGAFGLIPRLR